jgi:hypothetical protein
MFRVLVKTVILKVPRPQSMLSLALTSFALFEMLFAF